ncbi:unnamed protein product [Dicrocoelium dendriticum]|nr:unnamed protein product [Dicrocoelium dendriticum]
MDEEDATAIRLLSIPSHYRTAADFAYLHNYLRNIEGLAVPGPSSAHRDSELRAICQHARYRRVPGDVMLYQAGDVCDSWFILLSGSVLIDSSMFLPRACFGTRINGAMFRRFDCLVLEPSDLIVIDYPNKPAPGLSGIHRPAVVCHKRRSSLDAGRELAVPNDLVQARPDLTATVPVFRDAANTTHASVSSITLPSSSSPVPIVKSGSHVDRLPSTDISKDHSSARRSQLSDTSSAQSMSSSGIGGTGSDRKESMDSSLDEANRGVIAWSISAAPVGDSSLIDSDEDDEEAEEDFESSSHESLRDAFWESILKVPSERTEEDIRILMENVQQLPAFSNLTKATCRALCSVMIIAMVHEAGQVVLDEDEPLDTWSVVLNGTVEVIEPDGTIRELTRGDAFGVRPVKGERTHRGVMRTVTEDCQFACVPQVQYMEIMSKEGEAEIPEVGEGGRVVLVYEALEPCSSTASAGTAVSTNSTLVKKVGRVVTKGTPEKLIEHLVADLSSVDVTYPEDFLLTYRTFLESPKPIVVRLLSWHLHSPHLRPRVNRIVLLWIHNHFSDFADNPEMMRFLEQFDRMLISDGTAGERRLFQLACSTKARPREVVLDLPLHQSSRTTSAHSATAVIIPFSLIGGQHGVGIFVDHVDSKFASALETNAWNPAGKPTSPSICSSSYPSSSSSSAVSSSSSMSGLSGRQQIRRADQLLSINGNSVDGLSPSEVIQLIHSFGCVAAADCSSSFSFSSSSYSSASDDAWMPVPVCTLRLVLVYNPVQYHQLIRTLESQTSSSPSVVRCQNHTQSVRCDVTRFTGSYLNDSYDTQCIGNNNFPTNSDLPHAPVPNSHLKPPDVGPPLSSTITQRRRSDHSHERSSDACIVKEDFNNSSSSFVRSHSAHASPTRVHNGGEASNFCENSTSAQYVQSDCQHWPENRHFSGSPKRSGAPKKLAASDNSSLQLLRRSQRSSSQPDLTALELPIPGSNIGAPHCKPIYPPEHTHSTESTLSVIRVWRSSENGRDHSSKLVLLPRRQTNALEATRLAAEEFCVPEDEFDMYCLYHVTVEAGPLVKQSRLANSVDDLAGRMTLNARYYLKHIRSHEPLIADDLAKSILAESRVTFLQLSPEDLAVRLTLDDYEVFRAVQSTEYIDEVFGLSTDMPCPVGFPTGRSNLDRFTELVNREAYWVPTEICSEPNLSRRVDMLKRFIKLAKLCRELRNFNTMFCLLVGLHQTPVERLKQTWERLPNKYHKLYRDLSMVLDTSRNFFQYRNLLTANDASAPMLPYLPLVLKDLTFIHLGNPSQTADGLINFVKLRMLAKEIRAVCRMCNVDYDVQSTHRLLRRSIAGGRTLSWAVTGPKGYTSGPKPRSSLDDCGDDDQPNARNPVASRSSNASAANTGALIASKRSASLATSPVAASSTHPVLTAAANAGGTPLIGFSVGGAPRRRSTGFSFVSSSGVNTKKLYDSLLVVLRIRTYLTNLCIICDPESLSQMSSRLEPGSKDSKSSVTTATTSSPVVSGSATNGWSTDTTTTSSSPSSTPNKVDTKPTKVVHPPTTGGFTEKPIPSISSPITSTTPTPLMRPILGAQSVEDARKLLALSEAHKRMHHRIPAFTFPSAPPQSNTAAQFVFVAPPSAPHAGVGLGQLQHPHHPPIQPQWSSQPTTVMISHRWGSNLVPTSSSSSCCSSSSASSCQNPQHHYHHYLHNHPHQHPHSLQQQAQHFGSTYTLMGSKSFLLDTLIPTPQRIGQSTVPTVRSVGMGAQHANVLHPVHRVVGTTNSVSAGAANYGHCNGAKSCPSQQTVMAQQNRIGPTSRNCADRVSAQLPNNPHGHSLQPQRYTSQQQPFIIQTIPGGTGPKPNLPKQASCNALVNTGNSSQVFFNGGVHHVKTLAPNIRSQQPRPGAPLNNAYRYPTANMHPMGVLPHQYKRPIIQRINQQIMDWKPNRPPPYELALALRQRQPRIRDDSQLGRAQQQFSEPNISKGSADSQSSAACRHLPQTHGLHTDGPLLSNSSRLAMPTRHGCNDLERGRLGSPVQSQYPPGAPRSATEASRMDTKLQERLIGSIPCSPPTRTHQRPAPPSYHQVVAMTRHNQQSQQSSQSTGKPPTHHSARLGPERPIPPTRTVATLSGSNHASTRSASVCPTVGMSTRSGQPQHGISSSEPSYDPHKPRRHFVLDPGHQR